MSTELNKKDLLKAAGLTCRSCWWREGDRCYAEPCEREEGGRSKKMAEEVCENHTSKRSVLESFLPKSILKIQSEENEKAKGNDTGIY